ncbi:hypothetical protein DVH24_037045 [Malus domestica]|uniref:Uncharacterized protein n=1 Tax=Malus domestica TaxID=3750 RepID=A0A498HJE8_MALDO|nr:hypothetical protein DVH24_037045 [Malus domestica]
MEWMLNLQLIRTCREQSKAVGLVLHKGFSNENSGPKHQIDLNRCLTEEETETTAASSVMRTETVTDLEAPVIVETSIYGEDSTAKDVRNFLTHLMRALFELQPRL